MQKWKYESHPSGAGLSIQVRGGAAAREVPAPMRRCSRLCRGGTGEGWLHTCSHSCSCKGAPHPVLARISASINSANSHGHQRSIHPLPCWSTPPARRTAERWPLSVRLVHDCVYGVRQYVSLDGSKGVACGPHRLECFVQLDWLLHGVQHGACPCRWDPGLKLPIRRAALQ